MSKIRSIADLGRIAAGARQDGYRITLCHGTWDLLHLGHIRHLQQAARERLLFVTVTADEHVNKGPARPVFKAAERAEALAALDCVSYVGIVDAASAVPAIEAIKPHVYVKGAEYQGIDLTGKISEEIVAVERYGGKICFTAGETWSSSTLINRNIQVFDEETERYLAGLRQDGALEKILELIEAVKDYDVTVVGETIIDEYRYVIPLGKATKEPILAARLDRVERFAGGAVVVANVLASLVNHVTLITGVDPTDEPLITKSLLPNMLALNRQPDHRKSITKARYVDPRRHQKLFEVYDLDDSLWEVEPIFNDMIVYVDFGHGMSPSPFSQRPDKLPFIVATAQTNTANYGFNLATKYSWADYLCLDETEARLATQMRTEPINEVFDAILTTRQKIMTRGQHGCITSAGPVPAVSRGVADTIGTGDAFLGATAALVKAGGRMDLVGFVGNVAGALKANIIGQSRYVDKVSLVRAITALLK